MNGPSDAKYQFSFNGKVYQSIEEMPPEERAIFERLREKLAQKYPGQDLDSLVANALNRAETFSSEVKVQFKVPGAGLDEAPVAWGGAAGTAPVPSGFETVTGLGGAVKSYLAARENPWWQAVTGLGLVLVGFIMDGFPLVSMLKGGSFESAVGVLILPGTILFLLGAYLLIYPVQVLQRRASAIQALVIYRDGFAYRTPAQLYSIGWGDIASIVSHEKFHYSNHTSYTARRYSFSLSNGAEFTLTDDQFSEISEIEEAIKGSAYAVLLPPLKAAYQGGAPLTFGPVQVSQTNGLEAHGKAFRWDAILNVAVKKGRLIITDRDGKAFEVKTELIPNLEMLCQLIGIKAYTIDQVYI